MSSFLPTSSIGGLASGLDTATIINQLMSIERQPQTRLLQRKAVEEARLQALRDIDTRLSDLALKAASLKDVSAWGDVQSVESSDTSKVTVQRTAGAPAGAHTIDIGQLARAAQSTQQTSITSAASSGQLTITVGSTSVTVDVSAGDSLDTIADAINGSSGTPVYAGVVDDKLVLSSKTTGAANTISVTGSVAADFGFAQTLAPQDAEYWVNDPTRGAATKRTSASNVVTDALTGVTMTFKAATTTSVTVTIGAPAPDSDAVVEKVQAFVDQYNETVQFIRDKLNEEKVAQPQTAADRAKGVLKGDSSLTSLLSSLRQSVSGMFTGHAASSSLLSQVGLSTGATTGSGAISQDAVAGKLTLDADKLREALAANFEDVKKLFTNVTGSFDSEGLAQRFDRYLTPYTQSNGLMDSRISSEESMIDAMQKQSDDMETRLALREQALHKQFTALETALSQAQSQGAWLQGQLAQLG